MGRDTLGSTTRETKRANTLIWDLSILKLCLEDTKHVVVRQALLAELLHVAGGSTSRHKKDRFAFLHPVARKVDEYHLRRAVNLVQKIFESTLHACTILEVVNRGC